MRTLTAALAIVLALGFTAPAMAQGHGESKQTPLAVTIDLATVGGGVLALLTASGLSAFGRCCPLVSAHPANHIRCSSNIAIADHFPSKTFSFKHHLTGEAWPACRVILPFQTPLDRGYIDAFGHVVIV